MAPITAPNDPPTIPTYINGAPLPLSPDSAIHPVINAATRRTVYRYHSSSPSDGAAAAESALAAFQQWKRTPYTKRRDLLLRVADEYERRADELIGYMDEETSCGREWGGFQVHYAAATLRATAGALISVQGVIPPSENDALALVFKESVGPVLIIPPWNAPLILSSRAIGASIAAGCSIVLKASELCPRTHHAIVEIFEQCGLPKGVLNQVQSDRSGAPTLTEALLAHPAIRKVNFIGSASVGKIIGQVAAKYLKPILMELGSKAPAIVLDDADLKQAAELCAHGALMHHGQICFSTERIIIQRTVFEEFKELLVAAFEKRSGGTAATEAFAKHAFDFLTDAKDRGAEFVYGGPEYHGDASLKPAIVTSVPKDALMRDEETFGPSTALYLAEDDEDAIRQANDTAYGLSAAIHTSDISRAIKVGRELECGQVQINSLTVYDQPGWPIGGVKGSGWGRDNARWGLEEFLVDKLIALHPKPASFGV